LSDISVVTRANEPKTIAYAWFKSAGDNSEVPNHWVRGFEVYDDEAALAEVHRSSEPYKKMRMAVGKDQILQQPTDLRFLQPTGIGFMVRSGQPAVFFKSEAQGEKEKSVIVVTEIEPEAGMKTELLRELEVLTEHVEKKDYGTLSFWVLEYLPEYSDDGITVFSRFDDHKAYEHHLASPQAAESRATVGKGASSMRTTTWVESEIGFIGRE
jgi:quinol monooxygenase YgiN